MGNAGQVGRKLLDGEIGLAVFAGRPDATQPRHEQILTDRPVVIARPGHRLAGRQVRPEELAGERFILRERGSSTRTMQTTALALWELAEIASIEVWGIETVKQSVHAGLGLSLVSEHAVAHEVADGRLATLAVDPPPAGRPIVAGQRRDRLLSPSEQAFPRLHRNVREWPPGG